MSERPLRILFLDQYGGMGGGQRVLISLIRAASGNTVTVLAPKGGRLQAAIAHEVPDIGYVHCDEPMMRHGHKGLTDVVRVLRYAWKFRSQLDLLRQQDIIYVNGLRHLPHMLLWSVLHRLSPHTRVIYHIHLDHSALEKRLIRYAARLPATFRIIVNSRFVQDRLGACAEKTALVENALDDKFARLAFEDRFTGASGASAAVVGTVRSEKGQDVAVAATPPGIALHLIGPEGDGAADWANALRESAPAHVAFHGAVDDVPKALADRGIQYNLVPSRWEEPFGLAAIEGMACSCMTIVSGRGGLAEIAAATGALVARNTEELSRCLERLEQMPASERCRLTRAQYEATQARYAPARFQGQIRALLEAAHQPFIG